MGSIRSTLLALAIFLAAAAHAAETRIALDVIARRNADQTAMKRAIQEFGARLEKAGPDSVGLFYYAGHGVQLNGRNYLIPTTARIEREGDVEIEAVSADWVIEQMRYARNRLNIVILDACRNNPFTRSMRSVDHGLATMDAPAGILIAYSTAPGSVAADGTGRNSPYTEALTHAIHDLHEPVEQVFKHVRVGVMSATSGKQVPWESSSLTGKRVGSGRGAEQIRIRHVRGVGLEPFRLEQHGIGREPRGGEPGRPIRTRSHGAGPRLDRPVNGGRSCRSSAAVARNPSQSDRCLPRLSAIHHSTAHRCHPAPGYPGQHSRTDPGCLYAVPAIFISLSNELVRR